MTQRALHRFLIAVLVGVLIATSGSIAHANDPVIGNPGDADGDGNPDTEIEIPGNTGGNPGQNDPIYTVPGPYWDYYYTPHCMYNGPPGVGADVMCGQASNCPLDEDGDRQTRMLVYRMWVNPDGTPVDGDATWEPMGSQCRGPNDPP